MSAIIKSIDKNSIAEELGLEVNDKILSVNGENFSDILEFRFLTSDSYIELEVEKKNKEIFIYEIEKEDYENIGVEFENPLIDKPRSCRNKCIFCFIDQLPKGLRKPLYFKDDDTRLSFLDGNYVTLTNMTDEEIDRIIKIRLSPINISVHTTDDELRKYMLNNKNAGGILEKIKKFYDAELVVNCQIVLVKGVNDEEKLDKTMRDLSTFYPYVHSVSVVPVGISDHRENLYKLSPFTKEDAKNVISQIEKVQKENLEKFGTRIIYIADEFYIKGEIPFPSYSSYEDFPQIENGVGMMASFLYEVKEELKNIKNIKGRKTVVTGELAYPYFKEIAEWIKEICPDFQLNVVCGRNHLFGKMITVTGLLSGEDIYESVKNEDIGDALLLSVDTLRAEKDVFLDDWTPKMLSEKLGKKVIFNEITGKDFVEKLFS